MVTIADNSRAATIESIRGRWEYRHHAALLVDWMIREARAVA